MGKMKIYYYTTTRSEKTEEQVFDEYPDEINYKAKKGPITLKKDTIESISEDIEYREG